MLIALRRRALASGPSVVTFRETVAQLEAFGVLDQRRGEFFADAVVHQEAGRRDADLACVAELRAAGRLDGERDVGVFSDDDRRVAAELHRRALHVRAGQRRELLADRRRARERDLADHRMRNQVAGNLSRVAEHEADRTGRLLEHQLLRGEVARRHDPAIHAAAFVGEPFDDVRGGQHFAARFGERLALFLRHQAADLGGALAHQRGGLTHGRGALVGGNLVPCFEAALRGFERAVQIGDAGVGHFADGLAGGRVDDVERLAAGGVAPFAVDQKTGIAIAQGGHAGFL
ncbi:hypothetical protein OKW41_005334 [Paraburkholderia sp. UCT70]